MEILIKKGVKILRYRRSSQEAILKEHFRQHKVGYIVWLRSSSLLYFLHHFMWVKSDLNETMKHENKRPPGRGDGTQRQPGVGQ